MILVPGGSKRGERSPCGAARLVAALEGLAEEPRPPGCAKPKGRLNAYRLRIGGYRVVYEIHDGREELRVQGLEPWTHGLKGRCSTD